MGADKLKLGFVTLALVLAFIISMIISYVTDSRIGSSIAITALIMSLVGVLLWSASRRNTGIEGQVKSRTAELEQSNAEFRTIIENSNQGYIIHRDHKALYVNKEFVRLYGYDSAEEVYELETTQNLIAPQDRDPSRHQKFLNKEHPIEEMEYRGLRKDGTQFWVHRRSFGIDWNGEPAVCSARTDITNRYKEQEGLIKSQQESEQRFRHAFENTPIGLALITTDGNRFHVNPALANFLGYTVDELMNTNMTTTNADEAAFAESMRLQKLVLDGKINTYRNIRSYRHKDGHIVWGEVTATLARNDAGEPDYFIAQTVDITESKRVADALHENEAMLSSIVNNLPAEIAVKDSQGRYQLLNPRFATRFGVNNADVIGKTIKELDFVTPQYANEITKQDQRIWATGEIITEQKEFTDPDGRSGTELVIKFPILDSDGNTTGIGTVATDITELDRAEAMSQQLSTAIDDISEIVVLCDHEDKIVFCNKIFRELNKEVEEYFIPGTPYETFLRAVLSKGLVPNAIGNEEQWLHKRMEARRNPSGVIEVQRQNNLWVLVNEKRLDNGGLMTISTDITELKRVEGELTQARDTLERQVAIRTRELEESQNRQRAIFDHAPIELYLKDLEGRYVEINKRFETLFNVKNEEVKGKLPDEIHDSLLGDQVRKHDLEVINSGEAHTTVQHASTAMGERILHTIKFPVFDDNKKIFGLGAVAVDITELKMAELEMAKAKEEAETANRAKSEFLSAMSHELRTPMNAILGFAQLLELDTNEVLTEHQQMSVGHIMKAGKHLLELINQILELSKIETGQFELEFQSISPGAVIEECLNIAHTMAQPRSITVINAVPACGLPAVKADLTRFNQVLLNLLSNAVKYNRDAGSVTISAECVSGDMLRVSVKDTGRGIAEKYHRDVFQPFERLGHKDSEIEGTGIGLAISRQLITALGGNIGFESKAGLGSTFWFELPLAHDEEQHGSVLTDQVEKHGTNTSAELETLNSRVLYVEDNKLNVQLMQVIFEGLPNTELVIAADAEQGIELANQLRPNLILMDIDLPGMNGIDATITLKSSDRTKDIPVIVISAAAMDVDIERAADVGFFGYLTKPINISETLDIVLSAIKESS